MVKLRGKSRFVSSDTLRRWVMGVNWELYVREEVTSEWEMDSLINESVTSFMIIDDLIPSWTRVKLVFYDTLNIYIEVGVSLCVSEITHLTQVIPHNSHWHITRLQWRDHQCGNAPQDHALQFLQQPPSGGQQGLCDLPDNGGWPACHIQVCD